MWKAPSRPKHEISQTYNDGVVMICEVKNVAEPGYAPVENLVPKVKQGYSEQALGIQRYYSAAQNQVQVQRVIRIQKSVGIDSQDVAVTEDGHQYRIDLVQAVMDVFPPSLDLTLAKIDHEYEVV